jgi:GH25 family lysozyme M1 (1,4-beta-N-acetylmuramidase)
MLGVTRLARIVLSTFALSIAAVVVHVWVQPDLPGIHGVDCSKFAGKVPLEHWQRMKANDWNAVVVGGWGSYGINPNAQQQLAGARQAGMKTAAYCLLHWDDPTLTGDVQVTRCLAACGAEAPYLRFVALDIESSGGAVGPGVDTRQRIREAVQAVQDHWQVPMIYSSRANWMTYARGTTEFSYVWLWVPRYDRSDTLNTDGKMPDGRWAPFGGWLRPDQGGSGEMGKQYQGTTTLFGTSVDLDIFAPSIFY